MAAGREKVVDGHHRAMARHFKLDRPVLAYVGTVPARWMQQALETHSSQLHQGADPANKSGNAESVVEALRKLRGMTASERRAMRERGIDAWSCDLEPADDGNRYTFRLRPSTYMQVAIGFGWKAGPNFGGIGVAAGMVRCIAW